MAVYRSIPLEQAVNRPAIQLTPAEKDAAIQTIAEFINLFKQANS